MAWVATAIIGTAVVGGIVQTGAAKDQAKATGRANREAIRAGESADLRAQEIRQPFVDIGLEAGEQLRGLIADPNQGLEEINPIVDFLRKEGFEDIQESAAAGGRLGAGGTLRDLTQFNTDLTATIVPQLQNQKFNQLFNLLGLGSNAASGQATGTQSTAVNTQNLLSSTGVAQGNAAIQQSNAFTSALSAIPGAIGAFGGSTPATPPPQPNFIGGPNPSTTTFTV